ncbi:structural constituent of ribosome [Trichomonas vaginalis G3]|uniref:structural constituent of ribosome n=1 Tax=Trichomonas vaginalis (strain ATCC PRA-98 / G3) TaxID=412133 RepID=UPI0021E55687|nr:structural constituent of ribosome [Trichomonas vaginalis G3]KAI5549008.1 structural constituent of ribosome [Trichomonas vaginalis G3]
MLCSRPPRRQEAVVLAAYPEGTEDRKFPYAIVMGIESIQRRSQRICQQKSSLRRHKLSFQGRQLQHVMLTRHNVKDEDFFKKISVEKVVAALKDAPAKKASLQNTLLSSARSTSTTRWHGSSSHSNSKLDLINGGY